MTTEGEQQEAVCELCRNTGERFDSGAREFVPCTDHIIPAPVVPSDLIPGVDERCAEHGEYGCEDCHISRLGIPASATMQDAGRLIAAPPTPSQDAEGDYECSACQHPLHDAGDCSECIRIALNGGESCPPH